MKTLTPLFAALMLCAAMTGGCVVDTDYPHDAGLTCTAQGDCPDDWTCDTAAKLCRPPGWVQPEADGDEEDVEDIYRGTEKRRFCGVLYDKLTACETEVREVLTSDTYDQFVGSDRTAFVNETCAVGMMEEMTDTELDDMLSNETLIPAVSCDLFASQVCTMLPESPDMTTNCP